MNKFMNMTHTTTTSFLLVALGISFLYSVITFVKLQQYTNDVTQVKGFSPELRTKQKTEIEHSHYKPCRNWLIIKNSAHIVPSAQQQLKNFYNRTDWCILAMVRIGEQKSLQKHLPPDRIVFLEEPENVLIPDEFAATMWPYEYAIRHGAQLIMTLDPMLSSAFYANILMEMTREAATPQHVRLCMENANPIMGPVMVHSLRALPSTQIQYRLYENAFFPAMKYYFQTTDMHQPMFAIGAGVYADIYNNASTFLYDSFWALVPLSDRQIQSLWTLRLLRESRKNITFIPLSRYVHRVINSDIACRNCRRVADFLDDWRCMEGYHFASCMTLLTVIMRTFRFVSDQDVENVQVWINLLRNSGYQFPDRVEKIDRKVERAVNYLPTGIRNHAAKNESVQRLSDFCAEYQKVPPSFQLSPITHYSNTALIINFNHPHHENIPLLLTLYAPWFANVIFCSTFEKVGSELDSKDINSFSSNFGQWSLGTVSYVNVSKEELLRGAFSYICLAHVLEMNLRNIRGYLVISNDVLLNVWTYFDNSQIKAHFGSCETLTDSPSLWWFSDYGDTAVRKVRALMYNERHRLPLRNEVKNSLRTVLLKAQWCATDIYYITADKAADYRSMALLFRKGGTFLEIAVPKMIAALGQEQRYNMISTEKNGKQAQDADITGRYLWLNRHRIRPFDHYDEKKHFLHPFKFSWLNTTKFRMDFCKKYITPLFRAVLR